MIVNLKNNFLKNKKFIIAYLLFLIISIAIISLNESLSHLKIITSIIILLGILGISLIIFYSNNTKNLYKVSFLIIMIFGIVCIFSTPFLDVSDEGEHFARSVLISEGNILPDYKQITDNSVLFLNTKDPNYNSSGQGYLLNTNIHNLSQYRHSTIFDINWDNEKISYGNYYVDSVFSQNPFYGYLISALGIDLAKILNLNNSWMFYFGKIANLILYASICAVAIKISPIFKYCLLTVSCMPLSVYIASSFSIDSLIIALAILTIAYFFYLFKLPDKQMDYKKISIYLLLVCILGLCKVTLFIFLFLPLIIPHQKFKNKKQIILLIGGMILIFILGILWTKGYATPNTYNSWRSSYFLNGNVNEVKQLNYILSHPLDYLKIMFSSIFNLNQAQYLKFFTFGSGYHSYGSNILNIFYILFLGSIILLYPSYTKIKTNERIKGFIVIFLIYIGTFTTLYLTWNPVGSSVLKGVHTRYLIPLIPLMPFVFSINKKKEIKNLNYYVIVIILGFLSSMILKITFHYY